MDQKRAREVPICSFGADKKRLTVTVVCVGNGTAVVYLHHLQSSKEKEIELRSPSCISAERVDEFQFNGGMVQVCYLASYQRYMYM